MRIAVASDDGTSIAGHFGRCAGFLVYEAENGGVREIEFRANHFGHHQHGHTGQGPVHGAVPDQPGQPEHRHAGENHSHAGFIGALQDCQVVICRGMGRRAVADLAAQGIQPAIVAEEMSAVEAATLYAQGHLNASTDSSCCSH